MYITIKSLKKTLGKFVEMTDLYIGIPMLFIFLFLFCLTSLKIESLVFFTICVFLLIPIQMSKKNRMYKIIGLFFKYIFKCREYTYSKIDNGGILNEDK